MEIKRLENDISYAEVHGYQPMGDQRRSDGQIVIGGEIGAFPEDKKITGIQPGEGMDAWQKRSNEKFVREAADIYRVLSNNLPGGTLHQLLIQMLQGNLNLYVVQDIPDTTIKDIAEAARDYAWNEPLRWEGYLDSKKPGTLPLPADCVRWNALCQAIEKRYGPPPTEDMMERRAFGERLRTKRRADRLSLRELCKQIGFEDYPLYSRIELGAHDGEIPEAVKAYAES